MRIPLALALATGLAACQRPQPSPDYEKARQLHAGLVARSPLDPYAQPEMAQVMELLSRVPADSLDAEAARALREKVDAELRAQAEDRTRRARLVEGAGAPVAWAGGAGAAAGGESTSPSEAPAAPTGGDAARAAPQRPASTLAEGTALEEFQKAKGDCFEAKAPARIERSDGKAVVGQAWGLKDTEACKKAHPAEVGRLVLFAEGKLLEVREAADAKEQKLERKVQGELRPDGTIALPKGEVLPPGAKLKWEGPTPPKAPAPAPAPAQGAPAPAPAR
ncbi:MAG: hypothetical protein HZB56_21025 [Deltaproteobacteria bacterium]|nr:hypothetical protein [Deltaproteobacteria bacterium]